MKLKTGICPHCNYKVYMHPDSIKSVCINCDTVYITKWTKDLYRRRLENFWSAVIVIAIMLALVLYELMR